MQQAKRKPVRTAWSCLPAWAVEYRNIWGDATALLLVVAVAVAAAVFPAAWVLHFALASRRQDSILLSILLLWTLKARCRLNILERVGHGDRSEKSNTGRGVK